MINPSISVALYMVEITISQITADLVTHHAMDVEKRYSVSYEVTGTFYIKAYKHSRKRRFD